MRPRHRRTATLTIAAAASIVAVGTAQAAESGATAPSTTIAAAPTTAAAGPPVMLPPNATLEQIKAAIIGAFGPTTDITGELAPFVTNVPTGIPTPPDTVIQELDVHYYPDIERADSSYTWTEILFTSSLPAADLVTLYQSTMPAAGYVQTGDSVQDSGTRQIRYLTYDLPAPTTLYDEVIVSVIDETEEGSLDFVQLEISHGLDPALAAIYGAWPLAIPLVQGATLDETSFTTMNFGSEIQLELASQYTVAVPVPDALAQFQAALPGTQFTLDPASDVAGGSFDLTGGDLGETLVYMSDVAENGTTWLSLSTSIDIVV